MRVRDGLSGLVLGILAGATAALLLAPSRGRRGSRLVAAAADAAVDLAQSVADTGRWLVRGAVLGSGKAGLLPDEQLTSRIESDLERLGIWAPRVDITTVDGVVYLRGREADDARVETILAAVRSIPGVMSVVDEIHRD